MSPVSKSMLEKYLRGECTPEEEKHIRNWFDLNDASEFPSVLDETEYEHRERRIWSRLGPRLDSPARAENRHRTLSRRFLPYAAAILLLITCIVVWDTVRVSSVEINYQTRSGEIKHFSLPDGTDVLLNAMSSIRIPADYGRRNRTVYLQGEGYFDVQTDSSRAFIVISNGIATTALGTAFNIMAYQNGDETIVSLHEGRVSVNSVEKTNRQMPQMVLAAGEEVVYQVNGDYTRKLFNPRERLSWKDHVIFFDKADLAEVIHKLERYYGVRFHYEELEGSNWELTGEYRHVSLKDILESLSFNYGINYRIEGKEINLFK